MYRKSLSLIAVCALAAFLGGALEQWAFGQREAKADVAPELNAMVLNCRELRLVNKDGKAVACLSSDGSGIRIPSGTATDTPGLFFFDSTGMPRAMFGLREGGADGFANIYFYNKDGSQAFAVCGGAMAFSIDKVRLAGSSDGGDIKVRNAAGKIIFAAP
jgi:hypothetical protein